jgi:serine/threonine protein phosphatase PrpC
MHAKTLKLAKKEAAGELGELSCYGLTSTGKVRQNNEDSFIIETKDGKAVALLAVFDGMGGMEKGEVASSIAAETLKEMFEKENSFPDPIRFIDEALKTANERIVKYAAEHGLEGQMGTTAAVALIKNGTLYMGNAGDSRIYLLKDDALKQVTHDHTLVAYQLAHGLITKEEARNSKQKNVLMKAVGVSNNFEAEMYAPILLNSNDKVLLCSDGLYNMVKEQEIERVLKKHMQTREKAKMLIDLANRNGGEDNITAVIAETLTPERNETQGKRNAKKHGAIIAILIILLIAAALLYLKFVKGVL